MTLTPGALPLYQQLTEVLIRDIAAGRLADGERLPPEREMAEGLGVAVGTLRKALADLTEKGLVERVQGSGNYVRARADVPSVYAFFRLELIAGGGLPTAQVLSIDLLDKPAGWPDFGADPKAHRIRRLRRIGRTPVAVEEIWLDAHYAAHLSPNDLTDSLYLFYRQKLGLWIATAEDRLSVGQVPDWAPSGFGKRPGQAAGLAERISFTGEAARAEVSRTWFDQDIVRYVARLK